MLSIIPQIFFGLSILGILFIVLRKVPIILRYPRRFEEESASTSGALRNQWDKLKEKSKASEFLHDIIIPATEKFLRRVKIVVLKFDNFLAKKVDKLREKIKKRKRENGGM